MISSEEAASTGSSPGTARVTSASSSPAASEMIAAGRACRPTDEPTVTVLLGMWCSFGSVQTGSGGSDGVGQLLDLLLALGQALQDDHAGAGHRRSPAARAIRNPSMLPTAKNTKMPPCGARSVTSSAIDSPPVTALPSMIDGMTRSGSAAANGIAPSVMNDAPSSQAALPFSRSAGVNSFGRTHGGQRQRQRRHHAGDHHRGHDLQLRGVAGRGRRGGQAGGGEDVGHLVDRAAQVEGHHQAEHDAEQRSALAAVRLFRPSVSASISAAERLAEDDDHHDAGDQRGEQRDDHDRHQAAQPRSAPSSG